MKDRDIWQATIKPKKEQEKKNYQRKYNPYEKIKLKKKRKVLHSKVWCNDAKKGDVEYGLCFLRVKLFKVAYFLHVAKINRFTAINSFNGSLHLALTFIPMPLHRPEERSK